MFIGLIKQGNASREFNGYLDREASRKKTIENVFVKGDRAFLSGTNVLPIFSLSSSYALLFILFLFTIYGYE